MVHFVARDSSRVSTQPNKFFAALKDLAQFQLDLGFTLSTSCDLFCALVRTIPSRKVNTLKLSTRNLILLTILSESTWRGPRELF